MIFLKDIYYDKKSLSSNSAQYGKGEFMMLFKQNL
jgi:hypothetical protein